MSEKTKVVVTIPDFSAGGAETMVSQLVSNLDFEKFDVFLLVIRKPLDNFIERSVDPRVKIIYLNKGMGFDIRTVWRANRVLKKIKPDVIHTHLQSFMYVAWYVMFHRVRMLHTVHNTPEEESRGIRRKVLRFLFKRGKAIPVGISDTITSCIKTLYAIDRCETVYNPVDTRRFFPAEHEERRETFRIITIGRMTSVKNQALLIETFAAYHKRYPNSELIVLGDGPLREELVALTERLGCNECVRLPGVVSDVRDRLVSSDVFVLTSLYEGLPMTILEAMACGLPVISTDVGGIRDIVGDNGILIDTPDREAFLTAFEKLGENPEERKRMGARSRTLSEQYSVDSVCRQYESLYLKYGKRRK